MFFSRLLSNCHLSFLVSGTHWQEKWSSSKPCVTMVLHKSVFTVKLFQTTPKLSVLKHFITVYYTPCLCRLTGLSAWIECLGVCSHLEAWLGSQPGCQSGALVLFHVAAWAPFIAWFQGGAFASVPKRRKQKIRQVKG